MQRDHGSPRRALALLTSVALIGAAGWAAAQAKGEKAQATSSVPRTAQDHLERAKTYDAKAKEYREEAQTHRQMMDEAVKKVAVPGQEEPWITKMRTHCEGFIRKADALAQEAESFAQFHRMRAKEMLGQ
jgi:uncharacterized protein HemX